MVKSFLEKFDTQRFIFVGKIILILFVLVVIIILIFTI